MGKEFEGEVGCFLMLWWCKRSDCDFILNRDIDVLMLPTKEVFWGLI
jgi:hypothetical protein